MTFEEIRKRHGLGSKETDKSSGQTTEISSGKANTTFDDIRKRHGISGKDNGVSVSSKQGVEGWKKYLADQEAGKEAAKAKQEDEKWWEALVRYLGDAQDTSLPMANTTQVINDLREDVSYKRPNDDWSETQRLEFGALYIESPEKAYEYAEKTNNANNKAKEEAKIKEIQDSATSNLGAGFGHTVGAIATAPLGMADYLSDLAMANAGRDIAPDGHVSPFEYSQAVTEGVATDLNERGGVLDERIPVIGGKGWGDVYGLGTSIAQSMASAYALGPGGVLVSYFGQGAAAGVDEALERGASEEQAVLYGTALGVFEGLAENIGVDNLFKLGSSSTVKGFIKNVVKQAGAEGAEEGLTSLFSNIADNVIMGEKSNFYALVGQYVASGMSESEAKKKAWMDAVEGIAFDTIAGAVSGGVSGGIHTTVNTIGSNINAKKVYGDSSADLINKALELGGDAKALAEEYQAKLDGGKKLSGANLNRLAEANENTYRTNDTSKITSAVEARLTALGEKGNVSQLAKVLAKQTSGESLTHSEKAILKNSTYGQRVANELNPSNIESGQYASTWAENIGTERINAEAYGRAKAVEEASVSKNTPAAENATEGKFEASTDVKHTIEKDGKEVEVKIARIASIENGEMSVELEDGSVVNAGEVNYGAGVGLVYQAAADMASRVGGFNTDTANVFVKGFNPGGNLTAAEYVHGFSDAYRYGTMGYPVSELESGVYTSKLTEEQRTTAYNFGKAFGNEKVAKKQAKIASTVTIKPDKNATKASKKGKGRVHFDGSVVGKNLNERQKASLKALGVVAESLGIDIHVFESPIGKDGTRQGANGWYDPKDNSIHIDLYAGREGDSLMLFTASHELTHFIREWSPAKFKTFADFLLEEYNNGGKSVEELIRIKKEFLEAKGRITSDMTEEQAYDLAYEEVIADSCEAMLTDSNAIETLAKLKAKDKGLFDKIKEFISKLVARIKEAYDGLNPDSAEANYVREMKEAAEKLQKLWTEALVDASEASNLVEINTESKSVSPMFSERTWTASEYVTEREETAKKISKALGVDMKTAYKYIDDINGVARLIADDRARLDYEPNLDDMATVLKPNSEYKYSVDMSTLCAKRLLFTGTFDAIQRALPNKVFDSEDIVALREMMQKRNYEVACGICYVESTRREIGRITQDFIDSYKEAQKTGKPITRVNSEGKVVDLKKTKDQKETTADKSTDKFFAEKGYTPTLADLNTTDIDLVKRDHPLVYEAYLNFMNARGQAKPKLLETRAEYKGEILKHFKYTSAVNARNNAGGLRLQSFSDFEVPHMIDMMQIVMDMSRVGLKSQAYTKVPAFAEVFGDTGVKINLSLIAKGDGLDSNGNLVFDDVEGINHNEAFKLRDKYSKNVGTILVGKTDAHIIAAMADPRIDYIIPFHKSSWKESLYDALGLTGYADYTDFQNEKSIDGSKIKNYDPSEYWDFSKTGDENAQIYLAKCREDGRIPKFSQFQGYPGYWKLLIDFKMYDNDGVGAPQEVVMPIFNTEASEKILREYKGGHKSFPVAKDVVEDFVKEHKGEVKYSDRSFASQVDAVLSGADTSSSHLKLMVTPMLLQKAGLPNLPVLMTANHLKKITATSGHGLDVETVKKLPQYISSPVMIADSLTRDDSIVIITEAIDSEDRPVVAAILLNGSGRVDGKHIDANIMTSAYGKDNFQSFLNRIVDSDSLIYWDEKKSKDLSVSLGLQLPNAITSLRSGVIIHQAKAFVNTQNKKVLHSDRDSDGNTLSKEQQEFFKNSKARDSKGDLIVLYHGTSFFDNITEFRTKAYKANRAVGLWLSDSHHLGALFASYMGDDYIDRNMKTAEDAEIGHQKKGGVYKLYANVTNPLVVDALVVTEANYGGAVFKNYKQPFYYEIPTPSEMRAAGVIEETVSGEEIATFARGHGYDGVIIKNVKEGYGTAVTDVIAFEPNQVKYADNKVPTSNTDIRYSDRSITPITETEYKTLEEHFGTTGNFKVAGYLLPDGKLLDFSGKHWGDSTSRTRQVDHRDAQEVLQRGNNGINDMVDMIGSGSIRLMPEVGGINLAVYPNEKQRRVLSAYINYMLATEGQVIIDYDVVGGDTVYSREYDKYATSSRILGDIRNYFNGGRTSDLMSFHTKYSDRASYAPTFYSHMGKVIDGIRLEKMGAGGVVSYLKGKGVKDEEIKWSGIEAFLEGKKSVTKAELQEFVAGSQLQIVEQMSNTATFVDEDGNTYTDQEFKEKAYAMADEQDIDRDRVKFVLDPDDGSYVAYAGSRFSGIILEAEADSSGGMLGRWSQYKLDGGSNYREIVFQMPNSSYSNQAMRGHWGQDAEGVLAHARIQDMTTSDGKKMLFIEEIQSDYHNEGHQSGYTDSKTDEKIDELKSIAEEKFFAVEDYSTEMTGMAGEWETIERTEKGAKLLREYREAQDTYDNAMNEYVKKIPDAPFRTTYHEFVLKRLLRMAAEEGYDSIGWTPAWIQGMRWSEDYSEGYRIEYDQDIPSFLKKYGKKWGAKVGETSINSGGEDFNVWSMDIPDSMKASVLYEGQVFYSDRVTDKKTLDFLNNQKSVRVYRAMQVIDGELYPPMAAKVKSDDGKKKLVTPSKIGAWEQAVERPDLIRNGNKFELDKANGSSIQAAYNPYFHTSASPLNDQFSSAYKRPNLVIVEGEIPSSELTSGYRAEFAKDTVGETKWHSGPVASKLKGDKARRVYLSRWFKPMRIVPDSEVASIVAKTLEGESIEVPYNVVTPSLRAELENVGVPIKYQDRNPDSLSNRSLLANALETATQNDIERDKLKQYKQKIDLINSEEQKLRELREKIKELSFAKGPRDTEAIKKLQFEANQAANRINTYDRQLLNLESTKALKGVLDREKEMARKRAEMRSKESLERYKERAAKTQRELMTRYQESRNRATEGRHKTAMRHKIKDVVNELHQYLIKGTKDKHVPIELQKPVAEALDAVNMDTVGAEERIDKLMAEMRNAKTPEAVQEISKKIEHIQEMGGNMEAKLSRLKSAYDSIINSDDPLVANSHDDVISSAIEKVIEYVGDTPLRDMSLHQLEAVYDMYKMVLHSVRNANKAFKAKKSEEISVIANRVMEEIDKVGSNKAYRTKAAQFLSEMDWNNTKPVYAFERIGSDTFTEVFSNVRAGEDVWAKDMTEAQDFRTEQYKKHKYDSWDFKKRYGFTSTSGMHFELSLNQIMSLYAYSKREQAKDHLKKGGIVFDETTEVTVKNKLGIPIKFNPTQATAYNLSDETLADIIGKLTDEQRAFVDVMQDYLSTTMGEKGNEVSLELYGVKLFKEKHYFPLKSATQFMAKAKEQQKGEVKIKNSGFSKETVQKASNPIVLTPFMDVWAGHVNEMSMYHAFVLALEDFYRVYNYKTPTSDTMATESVEMFLQNAYGKGATKYIDQLLKDLNGGARVDSTTGFINKMMGVFKKSAVFASLSVVVQQPSAIARATALVDSKHFVGKPLGKHSKVWEEVKKYAPVAVIKEMGYFDTGMGKSSAEWLKGEKTLKDKMDDAVSKAPALADEYAWCAIWNAVKRETLHTHNDLKANSEEFLKIVGERFTEVIVKTQVYDSVLSRSANMRSKDTGMKMATAFMAEPTTSINMLQSALIQGKRGNKRYARKAVGSVLASMILNSILVSFVYAGRDDDEEKTYAEKYIGTLTEELLDSFNPLTLMPFVKDIVSIVQGYDVERSDMAAITDLINAWKNLSKEDRSAYRKVEDFAGAVAAIFGLPVKNIMRDVRGMYNTANFFINGEPTTGAGVGNAVAEAVTGKEKSDGQQLYEAMVKGDTAQIERVKGRFEGQSAIDSALRKALRDNDPRIKQAAEARFNGDIAEYMRIAKDIIAEGNFSQDNIVAAINSEVRDLMPDEEKEETANKVKSIFEVSDFFVAARDGNAAMAYTVREDIINAYTENGKDRDEAEADFNSKFASHVREQYEAGEVSAREAKEMLVEYGEKSEEDASSKVQYWDFRQKYPDYDLSEEAVKKYYSDVEPSGISVDVYYDYSKQRSKCKGTDNDGDGKTDSGSVKAEVLYVINSLPILSYQKDALYYLNGWAESTIWQAPWH